MDYQENQYSYNPDQAAKASSVATVNAFMTKVYLWMSAALVLTSIIAIYAGNSLAFKAFVLRSPFGYTGMLLVWMIVGFAISFTFGKMNKVLTATLFMVYAVFTGLALANLFWFYSAESILFSFGIAGGTFLMMSIYGLITKRDLTGIGQLAMMGVFGVLIALLFNMILGPLLWRSSFNMIDLIISIIAVFIFLGLIAYQTQKLKQIATSGIEGQHGNLAIYGAFVLYTSFINLFLFLLRIFGRRN